MLRKINVKLLLNEYYAVLCAVSVFQGTKLNNFERGIVGGLKTPSISLLFSLLSIDNTSILSSFRLQHSQTLLPR